MSPETLEEGSESISQYVDAIRDSVSKVTLGDIHDVSSDKGILLLLQYDNNTLKCNAIVICKISVNPNMRFDCDGVKKLEDSTLTTALQRDICRFNMPRSNSARVGF